MLSRPRHQLKRAPAREGAAARRERIGLAHASSDALDLRAAAARFGALSTARVRALVESGEQLARRHAELSAARELAAARVGDQLRVPCAIVRPGQVQLSFDRAREHVEKFLRRLHGTSPHAVRALAAELGLLEVPCIVGPRGLTAVLPDRNHNFAALLALLGWLDEQVARQAACHALRALHAVFLGDPRGPAVTVRVTRTHAHEDGASFTRAMRDVLFLTRTNGAQARALPARFSELEDNPVRALVSRARVKAKRAKGDKRGVVLSTRDACVWVKGPDAPAYVEFHLAQIVAPALAAAGRALDASRALTRADEDIMRRALTKAARDPAHPARRVLARIAVVPEALRDADALARALTVDVAGTPTLTR